MSRLVFAVMGTMASVVAAPGESRRLGDDAVATALEAARTELQVLDRRFSHYTLDSEISTWLSGGSVSPDALADFDHVLRQCGRLRDESGGVFTITSPTTGSVDTAGYVKGFAIRRAATALRRHQVGSFMIVVGGDTYCAGAADGSRPWRIAVADPLRSHGVAAMVEASDVAVATSGTAERGEHIWNGAGRRRPTLLSFTVIGPDIAEADAYATIGFAMGEPGMAWVARHDGYRSVAIRSDGSVVSDAALVSAA